MSRRLLITATVVALLATVLTACSDDATRVADLRAQVAGLTSSLNDARVTETILRGCVSELRNVIDGMNRSVKFMRSAEPSVRPSHFSPESCEDVLNGGAIRRLKVMVATTNRAVNRESTSRLVASMPSMSPTFGDNNSSGATAICNDGSRSYSDHASGTCSWHGGVRKWLNYPGN